MTTDLSSRPRPRTEESLSAMTNLGRYKRQKIPTWFIDGDDTFWSVRSLAMTDLCQYGHQQCQTWTNLGPHDRQQCQILVA